MSKPKVLITGEGFPEIATQILEKKCEIITVQDNIESVLEKVYGVDAIFWHPKLKLDKKVLDAAGPQLKVVAVMSTGTDQIDLEEINRREIKFSNTAAVTNSAVANMAVLLALAASRKLTEARMYIEEGNWTNPVAYLFGVDIEKSTVGIVGLGEIGSTIAKRLKAFEIGRLLYTGHSEKPKGKELGAEFVSFDTLLKESDFVIASLPLTKETDKMFDAEAFAKMKDTAVFVNISRGGIVDQPALVDALKNNQIFAAGLDVTTPEPLPKDHELLKLPNVVITPHIAWALQKTLFAMAEATANNIIRDLFDGKAPSKY